MNKIINLKQAEVLSQKLRTNNRKLVITGGCFDILHIGHIKLLNESKKQGDVLMVLLENDKNIKALKGDKRPINPEKERAILLTSLTFVDYVLILPNMKNNEDYDLLIQKLMPSVITTTKNNPAAVHNIRQAKLVNAKVIYVINKIKNKSTTRLAKIISDYFI